MAPETVTAEEQLVAFARAAATGDRSAAHHVLQAVQDGVYRLALRMLGHPQDAEDATQEVLVIVLTHLGSFRGESTLSTWVWRIAARHLSGVKRGRREADSFEALEERLTGLRGEAPPSKDPESAVFTLEVRLRCTEAMILSLDRQSRIAYLLGDIFNLPGEEAAAVLEIGPAIFRKRLSRARERLHEFMRAQCGIFDPNNSCRCEGVAACATARGLLRREALLLANHPIRTTKAVLERATREVTHLMQVAEVIRDHPDYAAPASLAGRLRELLDSGHLELLRH
jgi:RNA polymerase sigma factor (sigma-70 family)